MTPMAYYNELDPYAAQWLRNLIAAGHIAAGEVDERSIVDVKADDLVGYTQCHFFAGIGGWSYALRIAGWSDDRPAWTGSCPCQPFSVAGQGAGTADPRHLWPAWFSLIRKCQPEVVFGEQVEAAIRHGWLDLVQRDLERVGYAVGAAGIPAASVGAPHIRQRLWFVAESDNSRLAQRQRGAELERQDVSTGQPSVACGLADAHNDGQRRVSDIGIRNAQIHDADGFGESGGLAHRADSGRVGRGPSEACNGQHAARMQPDRICDAGRPSQDHSFWSDADWIFCRDGKWRPVEPGTFPLVNGASSRVGRLRAYGNAIVPQVAAAFVSAYLECQP